MIWIVGGFLDLLLVLTLGMLSLRKGHWVMFLVGIALPIFWFIGALLPPSGSRRAGALA